MTRNDHSTLEVNVERRQGLSRCLEATSQPLPEVNRSGDTLPEVAQGHGSTKTYKGYLDTGVVAGGKPRICGLRRKTFLVLMALAGIVIVGLIVGVAAGLTISNSNKSGRSTGDSKDGKLADGKGAGGGGGGGGGNDNDKNDDDDSNDGSNKLLMLKDTRLAAANFTDDYGNENHMVVYQLENRAIYTSTYNSSKEKWVVSPIVDGKGDVSLDLVQEGTSLALEVSKFNRTGHHFRVYWQSPNNAIKIVARRNLPTSETSKARDWESPFSTDQYTVAAGSSMAVYERQCDDCVESTYLFYEGERNGFVGAVLDEGKSWRYLGFRYARKPSRNASMAVVSVPSDQGGSSRTLTIFYRRDTAVLNALIYPGTNYYDQYAMPRGVGEKGSITAFSTGANNTDPKKGSGYGFQILTSDPDAPHSGVFLTYFKQGAWGDGGEVTELFDCASRNTLAASADGRIYCLVGDGEKTKIVEWAWRGYPLGEWSSYTKYDSKGIVDTEVKK